MLDLRQLRILAAVADSGSMSRAAGRLSFTPSAVSQQIAALERQVGAALVVRHARGVRLTEIGRLLVERGATIDDQLVALEEDARDLIDGGGGRLQLAAFGSAAGRLVPAAIDRFRRRYPAVRLSLDIRDPQAATDAVRDGVADVALIFDYPDGPRIRIDDLAGRRLLEDPMLVALPEGHPAAGGATVMIDSLADALWIRDCSPDPTCRELLGRLCAEAGFRPKIAFESDNYLAIGRLVAAGVGVALVAGLAAEQMPAEVVLRRLDPDVHRRVTVLRASTAAPVADEMINILSEISSEIPMPVGA